MEVKIKVDGLAAMSRALRKIDSEAPKQLRLVLNASAETLVTVARPTVPTDTGAAVRSLKARSTRTSARVGIGGSRAPYVPWLDFGGEGRRAGRPARRDFIKAGRYIYPTLVKIRPRILGELDDALTDVARNSGLAVN